MLSPVPPLSFVKMPQLPFDKSDVRMRGFSSRTTVEAAIEWIDSALPDCSRLSNESVELFHASGRVLATNVNSCVNVPGFSRSMMDGFAVRAEETVGATTYNA